MLKTYGIYIRSYIITLRLDTKSPPLLRFALRASVLDLVAFVRLSLFKTKVRSPSNRPFTPLESKNLCNIKEIHLAPGSGTGNP
ncbi:hypothetical protein Hanom_Chr05g00463801 [Helianthus anomalus]